MTQGVFPRRSSPWMLAGLAILLLGSLLAFTMAPTTTTATSGGTIPFTLAPGESREIVVEERWAEAASISSVRGGLLHRTPAPARLPWSEDALTTTLHIRPAAAPGRMAPPSLNWEIAVPGGNPLQDAPAAPPAPPGPGKGDAEYLASWETRTPGVTRLVIENPGTEPASGEVIATFHAESVERPGLVVGLGGLLVFGMVAAWRPLFGRPPVA